MTVDLGVVPLTRSFLQDPCGVGTQKGPSWVCIIPFPHFALLCPPLLSAMLPGGTSTPATLSPMGSDQNAEESTHTAEDSLQWAVGGDW